MNALIALLLRTLLIVLSYLFVGWIGYTIYIDLRTHQHEQDPMKIPSIKIKTVSDQEIIERQYNKPEIILGRDPACDFPMDGEAVSLRHCKLSYHHKQWWAMDLQSTNGTFLNENLIEAPTVLTDGDKLRLGHVDLLIELN